jgi:hypothetical protein
LQHLLKLNARDVHGAGRIAAAVLVAAPLLSTCEADHIAARAVPEERGLHETVFSRAPLNGRSRPWSEPFALRFRAAREDGRVVEGFLFSANESAQDAPLLADTAEAPQS